MLIVMNISKSKKIKGLEKELKKQEIMGRYKTVIGVVLYLPACMLPTPDVTNEKFKKQQTRSLRATKLSFINIIIIIIVQFILAIKT